MVYQTMMLRERGEGDTGSVRLGPSCSGASAPKVPVGPPIERLKTRHAASVEENAGRPKQVTFGLPKNLAEAPSYPQRV